ncbi:expressed protein [Phakopsora pachyrhizi]|uniref:Expressed protein n=1 Tax=Phakopsora pachyrhizi TaxID=170000 RepID=A0AAV0B6P0_PHAPC|nr:expressed protein [Phakopsora pachyrhizi]
MQTFVVVWLVQIFIGLELYSAYQLSTKNEFHLYNETHSSQPKILLVSEGLLGGPESSGELLVRSSSISALPIVGSLTNGLLALSGLTALTKRLPFWSGLANGLIGRGSSPGLMKVPGSFGRNLNQVPGVPGDAPWSLPPQAYGKGIHCPNGLSAPRGVVLMVPGTGFSGSENYAKSPYADKLPGLGFAYCWISLPGYSTVDLQISGELVAYAIKSLAADSGRSISILTYSQGGSNVQWALTFWPSLRPLVASFVAMAPPMRGSAAADVLCMASVVIGGCVPALLQESMLSNYMRAINSGEGAYALASSTVIYTMMDEIVIPQVPQVS